MTHASNGQTQRTVAPFAHTRKSGAIVTALAASIAGAFTAFAMPAAHAGDDYDHSWDRSQRDAVVYTESNISRPGGNSILAYSRERGGRLKPLPGSPFSTRGTGVLDPSLALGPFDSDQLVITNAEHTLLFAVNPGSNSIAVFHIEADGGLTHVHGSPFPSGGSNPVSVGLAKDTLVVVNKAMDPAQPNARTPSYASFHVAADGRLSAIPASIISVAPGSSPSQALVPANARFAFGSDFLGGTLQSFAVQADGSLSQNAPQLVADAPFTGSAAPHFALGLAAHPSRPVVYAGLVTISKVAVYQYDANGVLSFVRAVDDSGAGVCWIRVNAEGTRMYTSNTGDNSISVYDTSDPLRPVQIQHQVLKGVGSSFQLELDPSGRTLFAISQRAAATTPLGEGSNLHVLNVRDDGRVFETEHSPLALPVPANVRPQGLATF
jgi:6-phosphogluconolactonase (cycloisomerase 2 family)